MKSAITSNNAIARVANLVSSIGDAPAFFASFVKRALLVAGALTIWELAGFDLFGLAPEYNEGCDKDQAAHVLDIAHTRSGCRRPIPNRQWSRCILNFE